MKRDTFIEIIKDFEEKELPDLIERDIEITRPTVKKALVFTFLMLTCLLLKLLNI